MTQETTNETNPAEELKKAAEAADQTEQNAAEPEQEAVSSFTVAEFEAAQLKAAESYDMYVRAVAEQENIRRRCAEDVQKAQKFGVEKFAKNLLPVVDSLEKAIEAAQGLEESAVKEGLEITMKQMLHALEVSGMKRIDPKGEKFDPMNQQAIAMVPAMEGAESGTVAQVFQPGWMIFDRVLRPAMVSVYQ